MKESAIELIQPAKKTGALYPLNFINAETVSKVQRFHKSFPMYKETPLVSMHGLAKELGLRKIFVKDESYRFGLNAFKVLGGSYAIGNYMARKLNMDISELPYDKMISDETRKRLGELTFVTATDGNHGRGVAWTANRLKQKSVVYMPKGSAAERLANIQAEGAEAYIKDMNYDDAVRLADNMAKENGWVLVQDTAWEGYTDVPTWIIQGYATMGREAYEQLPEKPTHIFLQAGVGSMAAAITGLFADIYGDDRPIITIVEPHKANCIYRTAKADDGKLHIITDDINTLMAGLSCGEPCSIAWKVLRDYADFFASCPDYVAAKGMRMLGNPPVGDTRVISGESGAATLGAVAEIILNPACAQLKETLMLDANSIILLFSTEGDTDRESYKAIVWDGKFPSL